MFITRFHAAAPVRTLAPEVRVTTTAAPLRLRWTVRDGRLTSVWAREPSDRIAAEDGARRRLTPAAA